MEPLLSTLNKVYSTKLSSAMFWGATRRTLVHTCPAHLRQRWERRRRPLGCEWLQVNSVKLTGTIGYPLGVEGGEAAPRGPRAGMGEKLRQQRSAEKQESGSTTEAPPFLPRPRPVERPEGAGRPLLCPQGSEAAEQGVGAPPGLPGIALLPARPSHRDELGCGHRFWAPAPRLAVSVRPARELVSIGDEGQAGGRGGGDARRKLGEGRRVGTVRRRRPGAVGESRAQVSGPRRRAC